MLYYLSLQAQEQEEDPIKELTDCNIFCTRISQQRYSFQLMRLKFLTYQPKTREQGKSWSWIAQNNIQIEIDVTFKI